MSSILVHFTDEDHKAALERFKSFGRASDEKYFKEVGPIEKNRNVGIYAERAFLLFKPDAKFVGRNDYNSDFISKGKRIEVKGHSHVVGRRPNGYVWVNDIDKHRCSSEYFVWIGVQTDFVSAHIFGFMSVKDFFDSAKPIDSGKPSPIFGKNGAKLKHWLLPIEKIERFKAK